MKTFDDLKALSNKLEEYQNYLLDLYRQNHDDTDVIIEFNRLGCALLEAYNLLLPFSDERMRKK